MRNVPFAAPTEQAFERVCDKRRVVQDDVTVRAEARIRAENGPSLAEQEALDSAVPEMPTVPVRSRCLTPSHSHCQLRSSPIPLDCCTRVWLGAPTVRLFRPSFWPRIVAPL